MSVGLSLFYSAGGDDPWDEFCSMVKRIYIYSYEEAKLLAPKSKLPVIGDTIKLSSMNSSHESVDLDNHASVTNRDC